MRQAALALTLHEQREDGGLNRRELGADGRVELFSGASLGASALAELEGFALADARGFVELTPIPALLASVDVLHTEPALLLSRSSVLSVFSTTSYDEVGGTVSADAARWLTLEAAGFAELYADSAPGSRGELGARVVADRVRRTVLRVGYTRLVAPTNGYVALHSSLSRELLPVLRGSLDLYGYFYDQPIRGYRSSSTGVGSFGYRLGRVLELVWSSSIASSPYARFDAQTLLDARLDFELGTRRRLR